MCRPRHAAARRTSINIPVFSSKDISFYIISLGCAKNLVDSERVNGSMISAGFIPAESSPVADILIINTCGFIKDAKEESIEVIFDALEQQRGNAAGVNLKRFGEGGTAMKDFGKKVVVTGCMTQRYPEQVVAEIPEIDFLYGIPDERFVERMSRRLCVNPGPAAGTREPLTTGLSYAYIKISEGCSNNCSYCAIPLIRGGRAPYRPELILDDARRAADRGARELVIVAQDTALYRSGDTGLRELVEGLSRINGVEWIRLMYCHPDHLDDRIIDILADVEKVVPYVDVPFQHVNERILRSMGRAGSAPVYASLLARLRDRVPNIRIRSTFMVGYPGETDREFSELMSFLEEARIDRAGAFTYSPEEGTRAWDLGDAVPDRTKKERYGRLMGVQQAISSRKLESMIGDTVRVLVEERSGEGSWIGRTEYDAPEVDGIFYLTGDVAAVNSLVTARVTGSMEHDLVGEVLPVK